MKPLDPRLLREVAPARRYIIVTAGLGALLAVLITLQALVIGRALAPVLAPAPLDADGLNWWGFVIPLSAREIGTAAAWLTGIVVARVAVTWLQERLAHRAGSQVISQLREKVVDHTATLGPRWVASGAGADVTTTVTRGLDALLPYFVRYLPQLMLAVTVTPALVLVVLGLDWISVIIVVVTIPLIPIFMILIGLVTRERSARHLEAMQRLSRRTLDLIAGIPTLKALGRERGPGRRVRELGEAQRKATMGSLRVAFLSGMVLELLTTLSVAIIAVTLGFRLVDGLVSIETALAVLVLAPEVYLPLRNVGTHFHASADGIAAADAAFDVLETPAPVIGAQHGPASASLAGAVITAHGLAVATPDGTREAPGDAHVSARPGELTALVGPNGEGKTTTLLAIMGLLPVDRGTVSATVADGTVTALHDVEPGSWTRSFAYVPQRPDLGPEGRRLSLGQRHLKAMESAFAAADRPVLVLDEPTAHLDAISRTQLLERLRDAAGQGRTVIVATHEPEVVAAADAVVEIRAGVRA